MFKKYTKCAECQNEKSVEGNLKPETGNLRPEKSESESESESEREREEGI
jgi:hypothetical protein